MMSCPTPSVAPVVMAQPETNVLVIFYSFFKVNDSLRGSGE